MHRLAGPVVERETGGQPVTGDQEEREEGRGDGRGSRRGREGVGYRSWRRNTLLRLSLTMSSSSVSCSLAMRGMSSRTRCCMARHVRLSSCGRKGDSRGRRAQLRPSLTDGPASGCAVEDREASGLDLELHRTASGVLHRQVLHAHTEHAGHSPHVKRCCWLNLASRRLQRKVLPAAIFAKLKNGDFQGAG